MDAERSKEQYRECMRNHAASLGTYATDGCGEYTPDASTPSALRCAACGCHRNFHRKYVALSPGAGGGRTSGERALVEFLSPAASEEGKRRSRTKFSESQKEQMLKFAERIGWKMQRREGGGGCVSSGGEDEIGKFCRDIGVTRQVFKVWMHNHKNSSASSSSTTTTTTTTNTTINMGSPSSRVQ